MPVHHHHQRPVAMTVAARPRGLQECLHFGRRQVLPRPGDSVGFAAGWVDFPYMDPAPIATTLSFLNEIRLHPYIRSFVEAFTSPRTLMGFAHLDLTNLSAA
jgi:hypothetical protein